MTSDPSVQRLHDKATRGELLSADEQTQLNQWYARQDQEEAAILGSALSPQDNAQIRAQVDAAVAQLLTVTQRIQVLAGENEAVRREIAALQRQLAQRPDPQPA